MTSSLLAFPPGFRITDANDDPISGAKLYFYLSGTTTDLTVYTDAARTTAHAQPVVADSGGLVPAIYIPDSTWKVVIKTSAGVTLTTVDALPGYPSTAAGANLSVTQAATTVTIVSDSGTDATIPAADTTNAGVMSAADKTALDGLTIGSTVQAWDADLDAIAALASTGLAARTAANTWAQRSLTAPAAGLTITNPAGVAGDPTFALANDLAALEGLVGTGLAAHTAADTWAERSLMAPAAGISISNADGVAGNPTFALADDLAAIEALASTGIAVRSAADIWVQRTLTGTAAEITVTNGDGTAGNPTISLPAALTFTGKTLTGGTYTSIAGLDSSGAVTPTTNDAAALGSAALSWSDLFLASGGILNWNNGNYTITHSAGDLAFSGIATLPNTGLHLLDTNASHDLIVKPGSDLTADRTFTVTTGDTDITLNLTDPAADKLLFWDDSAGSWTALTLTAGLSISGTEIRALESFVIACSDETTAITTGTAKVTFRMPYAFTLTGVRASLSTASSSGNPAVDINEGGVSIFSTTLTIDANEKTSTTATTAAVISDSSLADDAEITIDIDTAGTGAKGLKVTMLGYRP